MKTNSNGPGQTRCPVCGSDTAFIIEINRPVVFLCECDSCGKFIIRKKVLEQLLVMKSFQENRKVISEYLRNYNREQNKPLEIVLDKQESLARDSMTIDEILETVLSEEDEKSS